MRTRKRRRHRLRLSGTMERDWDKKLLIVDQNGHPYGALVSAFENDLRLLSRDFDPCKKFPKQIQPAKERFLKRVWAGTPFLFVPQTPKP